MMFFGESTFEAPVGLAAWLGCLAFLVVLANGLFKFARNVKGPSPTPPNANLDLRVTSVERATERNSAEISRVEGKVDQLQKDIIKNGEVRKEAIERKVNETRLELKEDIAALRDSIQSQHNDVLQAVSELRGKVGRS